MDISAQLNRRWMLTGLYETVTILPYLPTRLDVQVERLVRSVCLSACVPGQQVCTKLHLP